MKCKNSVLIAKIHSLAQQHNTVGLTADWGGLRSLKANATFRGFHREDSTNDRNEYRLVFSSVVLFHFANPSRTGGTLATVTAHLPCIAHHWNYARWVDGLHFWMSYLICSAKGCKRVQGVQTRLCSSRGPSFGQLWVVWCVALWHQVLSSRRWTNFWHK